MAVILVVPRGVIPGIHFHRIRNYAFNIFGWSPIKVKKSVHEKRNAKVEGGGEKGRGGEVTSITSFSESDI